MANSRHINATVNLGQSLAGSVFSFSEMLQLLSHPQLQAALPYWGLIQGALRTGQFIQTTFTVLRETTRVEDNSREASPSTASFDKWRYTEDASAALTNINLICQSGYTLHSGVATLLPWSFALVAAVEFGIAVRRTCELVSSHYADGLKEDSVAHAADLCKLATAVLSKLLAALGWTAIALGNPVGWILIAAASMERIYNAVSTYQQLSMFKQSSASMEADVIGLDPNTFHRLTK